MPFISQCYLVWFLYYSILNTGCAKIWKKKSVAKRLTGFPQWWLGVFSVMWKSNETETSYDPRPWRGPIRNLWGASSLFWPLQGFVIARSGCRVFCFLLSAVAVAASRSCLLYNIRRFAGLLTVTKLVLLFGPRVHSSNQPKHISHSFLLNTSLALWYRNLIPLRLLTKTGVRSGLRALTWC